MTDEERALVAKLATTLTALDPYKDHANVIALHKFLLAEFHSLTRKVAARLEAEAKAQR